MPNRRNSPIKIPFEINGHRYSSEATAKKALRQIGKKLSDETRAKLSIARKKRKHSSETCRKIGLAHKGKTLSAEARAKISAARTGKHYPKLSAAMKGKKHTSTYKYKNGTGTFSGKRHTPESILKISLAKKGYNPSPQTRAKMSAIHRGKIISEEMRQKLSKALRGRKMSAKWIAKHTGEKNCNWRGGISSLEYGWQFNAKLRKEVRERDKYKCQLCGTSQMENLNKLPIHHIDYDKKNNDPVNLITLCNACHSRTGRSRNYWQMFFKSQIMVGMLEEVFKVVNVDAARNNKPAEPL